MHSQRRLHAPQRRASLRVRTVFLTLALATSCTGSEQIADTPGIPSDVFTLLKVAFSPMYSAYDGVHDYKLPASLKSSTFDPKSADPVIAESVKWHADEKFVTMEEYDQLAGGVMLTTKAPGTTLITATAKTRSGSLLKGRAMLMITDADPAQWDLGESRYNDDMPTGGTIGSSVLIPTDSSCATCHSSNGLAAEYTPQQTAGYSDEDLISIFSQGAMLMGSTFHSPVLKMLPMQQAVQVYTQLHTWDIAPEVASGIVYKLRSLPPAPQAEIDAVRLR
jgi:hypothetical protein